MLGKPLRNIAVSAYSALARTGLTSAPVIRRSFLWAYARYKQHIEAGPVDQLHQFVPEGSAVIDVGANVGFFTEKLARWVGPAGTVIAVEPDSENLQALRRSIDRFGSNRKIEMVAAVATDRPGRSRLERNPLHPGDHRIAVNSTGIDVRAVTIDDLVTERGLRISFIKIDVQGAELMVLKGAVWTLRSHSPVLFVEVDDLALRRYGASAASLLAFLIEEGYTANRINRDGSVQALDSLALSSALSNSGYIDVLCRRPP
jgi:FkbM family methyltransferase